MSPEDAFRERAIQIRDLIRLVKSLEQDMTISTKKIYRFSQSLSIIRASSYITIYNAIEFSLSMSISAIRNDISKKNVSPDNLVEYWRLDYVNSKFRPILREGVKHETLLSNVASSYGMNVEFGGSQGDLPFSGNADQEKILRFCKSLNLSWKTPKKAKGGFDLTQVKEKRNDLSHGNKSFREIGESLTASDLKDMFDRIFSFQISLLRRLESYRIKRQYMK